MNIFGYSGKQFVVTSAIAAAAALAATIITSPAPKKSVDLKDYSIRNVFLDPRTGTNIAILLPFFSSVPESSAYIVEMPEDGNVRIIPARNPWFDATSFEVKYDDRKITYDPERGAALTLNNGSLAGLIGYRGDAGGVFKVISRSIVLLFC